MSTDLQRHIASSVDKDLRARLSLVDQDPEYLALRMLAERNRKAPPRTPTDALQHIADVAREITHATFSALAVTGEIDYVEGFVVSGMDDGALAALKGPPQGHGPLGTMRQDGLPVHILDVSEHAKAFGFPPKHPPMRELLGVPIFGAAGIRGALYVTDRLPEEAFGEADRAVLGVLAHHAGLVIDASWY